MLVLIGISTGLFGGLLGIGGSVIMIPAMVLAFGENQHLYQASAMICNFFVAASATFAHKKEKILSNSVIKFLIPSAVAGVILGVTFSNLSLFSADRSYLLVRIFGFFLIYVVVYNIIRLYRSINQTAALGDSAIRESGFLTVIAGLITGIGAGLLGLGGGTICIPLQQVLLRMPLKKAMANSSATIILTAAVGAALKNATLNQHSVSVDESVKIAAVIIPTAIIGGFLGARLMHILPKNVVRTAFIILMILASYRMLTV